MNFWQQLKKPIFVLAPMEDITDNTFREFFAMYGKSSSASPRRDGPSVMFTEFVSTDGLCHPEGKKKLIHHLDYTEKQRPIVAQIWGRDPEKFYKTAQLISSLGFDGIDINMGCPQSKEIQLKTCAALIREPKRAGEIIQATVDGAKNLPVSVKTRIGYSKASEMEEWVSHLLKYPIAALTLHARTKKEKSKVPAQWEKVKEAVEIRDKVFEKRDKSKKVLIIGNGDVKSGEEGLQRITETGCDGVMVGRGAIGNPWVFSHRQPSTKQRLQALLKHAELFEQMKNYKPFQVLRKQFKAYTSGMPGAGELRAKLMETKDYKETKKVVDECLNKKV